MEAKLQSFLLNKLSDSPEAVLRMEGGALLNLHNCAIGQRVEPIVKSECKRQPSLNLLEFLYPNASEYTTSLTKEHAERLSNQLPKFISRHNPLNSRQCHAVNAAVTGITNYTGLNPDDSKILTDALEGFQTWPEHLRGTIYWNLGKLSEAAEFGEEGSKVIAGAAHACACTLGDVPYGLADDFNQPMFWACLKKFKKVPGGAVQQFVDNGHLMKDSAALKCVGRAVCDAPVASDSMGEELLQAFTQQMKLTQTPIGEKCEALEHVAKLSKNLSKGSLPSAFSGYLKQLDISDVGWKSKLQKVVEQVKDPNSNLSKLFTPKVKREVKKDYILMKDKEGKLVFQRYEAYQTGKEKPQHLTKPLAAPAPNRSEVLVFDATNPENSKIVEGLVAQDMLDVMPQKSPKGKLFAKPKPKLLKKLIPTSSMSSYTRSLGEDLQIEVIEQEGTEIDI